MSSVYEKNSLSLIDALAMGTGMMIGAGILTLTGQVAELAGPWFPMAFIASAVVDERTLPGVLVHEVRASENPLQPNVRSDERDPSGDAEE